MGFDLSGRNPSSEAGKYFCNNNAWWHPLAEYCCEVAPRITRTCKYWHSNDGDGLSAIACVALADRLQADIDSGRAARIEARNKAEIEARKARLPSEPCPI